MSPQRDSLRTWAGVAAAFVAWTLHWLWPLPLQWTTHLIRAPYWWDAQLALWYLSESQHNLLQQPGHLLDARILHPAPDVLAYSENFLAWALPGRLLDPLLGPIGAFNTWMGLALVTSGLATYAWLRPRVESPWPALAGAVFFAYAPWRLGLLGRLQLQSTMLLPLVLLALEAAIAQLTLRKWLWVFGLFALQFGLCIYYGVYLLVLAVPATLVLLGLRWRELPWLAAKTDPSIRVTPGSASQVPSPTAEPTSLPHTGFVAEVRPDIGLAAVGRRQALARLVAAAVLIGVPLAALLWPYLQIPRDMGLQRDPDELRASSGILRDLLTSSELMRHWQGLAAHHIDQSSREPVAFPGAVPLVLAAIGAVATAAQLASQRKGLWVTRHGQTNWRFGPGILWAWLALCGLLFLGTGPNAPGGAQGPYGQVFASLPLLKGLRFTNRFVVPATLFGAVLVAWGAQTLMRRAQRWGRHGPLAAGCLAVAALALELDTLALPLVQPPPPELIYQALAADRGVGAVAELPMDGIWHTQRLERNDGVRVHGHPTLGGFTGYNPPHHAFFREVLAQPFSEDSRRLLAALGVNRVLIHWHWIDAPARMAMQTELLTKPWLSKIGGDGGDDLYAIDEVPAHRAAQIRAEWPTLLQRAPPQPQVAIRALDGAGTEQAALTDHSAATSWSPTQGFGKTALTLRFSAAQVCGLWMDSRRQPHRFARGLRIHAQLGQQPPQLIVDQTSRQPLPWLTQAPARSFDAVQWPAVQADTLLVEVPTGDGDARLEWAELMVQGCQP